MVALVKRAFNEAAANGTLITWSKLQDVLPDVEVTLNNHPLSYIEEDTSYPYSVHAKPTAVWPNKSTT